MFVDLTRWRARRQRRLALLSAALVVASTITTTITIAPTTAHADDTTIDVTAWAPYWKAQEALPSFQAQSAMFNELTPFFFSAVSATNIIVNPSMSKTVAANAIPAYKAAAGSKPVIATIVDGMPPRGMAAVLADPASRAVHVQALVDFALNGSYSGIDLDYEQFAFTDGGSTWALKNAFGTTLYDDWGMFLTDLSNALH